MIALLALLTAVKLVLAASVGGTADIPQQLEQARAWLSGRDVFDPQNTGSNPSFFPPGHYALAAAAVWIAEATGTSFAFWIKTPAILADFGVALLLWRIPIGGPKAALAYMVNPLSLLLSVYHGQVHTVAVAAGLFALWCVVQDRFVAGAALLAVAASVRQHLAVLIVPAVLRAGRDRALGIAVFAVLMLGVNLSVLSSDHPLRILAPTWSYGTWGYTIPLAQAPRVLALAGLPDNGVLASVNATIVTYGASVYWVWAAVFTLRAWWRPDPDLWRTALLFFVGFYTISPGFGVQWLIWALPFWLLVNVREALLYSALGGLFVGLMYRAWGFSARYGVASVTENLHALSTGDLLLYLAAGAMGLLTWIFCARAAWRLAWPEPAVARNLRLAGQTLP